MRLNMPRDNFGTFNAIKTMRRKNSMKKIIKMVYEGLNVKTDRRPQAILAIEIKVKAFLRLKVTSEK